MTKYTKYVLYLFILICFSCASMEKQKKLDTLAETTLQYEYAIQWGNYELANSFRKAEDFKHNSPDFEKLKKFKVSYYEVLKSDVQEDSLQAQQTVEIKYYNIHHMIEKKLIDEQQWEYDKEEKRWRLKSELPDFK